MKLRTIFLFNNFLLGVVTLVAAGALILIISFLHQTAVISERSLESLRVTEEFKVSLLAHNRFSLLQTAYPSLDYSTKLLEAEAATKRWLIQIRNFIDNDQEKELFERVKASTQMYLVSTLRNGQLQNPQVKDHIRAVAELDIAYEAIKELIELKVQQAQVLNTQIQKFDTTSDVVGLVAFLIVAFGISTLVWTFRSKFYLPVLSLRAQIVRFGKGDFSARVENKGVVELKEIASAFNDLANNLSVARKTQLRFLASIAHDIKNPLGAIKMAAQLLGDDPSPDSNEIKPVVDIIIRQTDHLERLVTDLLDITRLEAGQIELKLSICDLRDLAKHAVKLYESVSKIHHLRLVTSANPLLWKCDSTRVSQVLNNMLSNAIKYSPQGGEVLVTVTTKNDFAIIEVKDQGLGVEPKDYERIFEPFRRADATRDTIPGVGLGLSFARRIAQAHGGNVEVQSQANSGSTFTFTMALPEKSYGHNSPDAATGHILKGEVNNEPFS